LTGHEFDVWMARRARDKPNNPLYAGMRRIGSVGLKSESVSPPVSEEKAPARPIPVTQAVDLKVPAKDVKQEAADHDDDPFDGIEPEEGNQ
jgi:hypothetical protein